MTGSDAEQSTAPESRGFLAPVALYAGHVLLLSVAGLLVGMLVSLADGRPPAALVARLLDHPLVVAVAVVGGSAVVALKSRSASALDVDWDVRTLARSLVGWKKQQFLVSYAGVVLALFLFLPLATSPRHQVEFFLTVGDLYTGFFSAIFGPSPPQSGFPEFAMTVFGAVFVFGGLAVAVIYLSGGLMVAIPLAVLYSLAGFGIGYEPIASFFATDPIPPNPTFTLVQSAVLLLVRFLSNAVVWGLFVGFLLRVLAYPEPIMVEEGSPADGLFLGTILALAVWVVTPPLESLPLVLAVTSTVQYRPGPVRDELERRREDDDDETAAVGTAGTEMEDPEGGGTNEAWTKGTATVETGAKETATETNVAEASENAAEEADGGAAGERPPR